MEERDDERGGQQHTSSELASVGRVSRTIRQTEESATAGGKVNTGQKNTRF